ncbi:hypothetical protein G3570_05070 [Balneolaceae bacterium YR4-1]|uniref:Uncharacterized protein n=1 Tax=Halalkalibaculum roseum TaxID=2709311 RepID=A0A6M1SLV8_9BACT|nr:hypothetical protein [Halalkalibaculum roseum]NGP75989.1 hypothetical protein [Halalkalibaculum roseum]
MRKQLIAKIKQCDTTYQIREVWEEVTNCLKSDQIDMDDFVAIRSMKYDRLNTIEASNFELAQSQNLKQLEKQAMN